MSTSSTFGIITKSKLTDLVVTTKKEGNKSITMNLSQLKLNQATLEIRYENAYLLWDRAGHIWSNANSTWAKISMMQAKPMITSFIINDRFEMAVKLDRAHFIDMKPSSGLEEFIENTKQFIDLVSKILDISEYERLGFRLIYSKKFNDKVSAADSLISTKLMKVPEGKHFNIEGSILLPQYSLVWEGKSTAIRALLTARDETIDLAVSPGIEEVSPVHIEKHEFIYDLDYYTLDTVSYGQLNIKEWISQAYHLIKRDSRVFLGG